MPRLVRLATLGATVASLAVPVQLSYADGPIVPLTAVVAPEVGIVVDRAQPVGTVPLAVTRERRGGVEIITIVPQEPRR